MPSSRSRIGAIVKKQTRKHRVIPGTSHAIVVGGGALGCAIAFRLARAGIRITLIERDAFGDHASGQNAGNLNPIFMTPPPLVPFALESFRLHPPLAEELARLGCLRYVIEPVRRILLAFDDSDRMEFAQVTQAFAEKKGFSVRPLDSDSVRAIESRVSKEVKGGLLMEGNMSVNGRALTSSLAEGAARLGATILRNNVHGLKTESGCVTAVKTEGGEFSCDAVIFATGAWVGEIKQWLGISLPVKPVKGQLLRMKLSGEGLRCDLTRGIAGLYRRNENEVWVGGTLEDVGLDETPTDEVRQHLLQQAIRIMPEIADAELLEHVAAVRPMTPSGIPIAEKASGWDNVYIANGGCNKGILLCTGIAETIRDLILNKKAAMPLNFQNA